MPFLTNIRLIAFGLVVVAIISAYFYGRWEAMKACDNRHKVAELENTIERKKEYERIEKKLPYSSDRAAKLEWLRQHARQ